MPLSFCLSVWKTIEKSTALLRLRRPFTSINAMDLSKGSSSNSPCNLAIAPERFYLVGVGAIPYSPATFFRTHFLRFILIAKSTANFNKLEKLTQWIDEKRLR